MAEHHRGALAVMARSCRRLFTLEQWCIGYAALDIEVFLKAPERAVFTWIRPDNNRTLLADPFGLERDGQLTILCECLTHGKHKGRLVALRPHVNLRRRPVLSRPFHLSYPFVIEHDAKTYVLPEQGETGALAFYEYTADGLDGPRAVIEGLDAIDPTVLHHDGRFWLFCTRARTGANGPLFLYMADSLFGPYEPHPQNPIVSDPGRARPAGRIIARGGRLLRPAQDCARHYGAAIVLNAIDTLTPTVYREHPVQTIVPSQIGGFGAGLHTLDHTEHFVLIDTKRNAFHPFAFAFKLADRLRANSIR